MNAWPITGGGGSWGARPGHGGGGSCPTPASPTHDNCTMCPCLPTVQQCIYIIVCQCIYLYIITLIYRLPKVLRIMLLYSSLYEFIRIRSPSSSPGCESTGDYQLLSPECLIDTPPASESECSSLDSVPLTSLLRSTPPPPYSNRSCSVLVEASVEEIQIDSTQVPVLLTPVTKRPRLTHPGCTTIVYKRKNNPELDRRRTHICPHPGICIRQYDTAAACFLDWRML